MVRNAEYAKLSLEVYRGTAPQGWENLGVKLPATAGDSGFYAAAYQSLNSPNEIVIAFRGTELPDDLGDLAADAALATDDEHQQFIDALEFADSVGRSDPHIATTITDHSVDGGGLAQPPSGGAITILSLWFVITTTALIQHDQSWDVTPRRLWPLPGFAPADKRNLASAAKGPCFSYRSALTNAQRIGATK